MLNEMLEKLSNIGGISGCEELVCDAAKQYLEKYCSDVVIKNNNVIGTYGEHTDGRKHVVLDAHIDQIGMTVTYITSDGFIKVGNVGGLDRRLLPSQKVIIHGKRTLLGVVCSTPPHLVSDETKVPEIGDILIDTGLSGEELNEIVKLGDAITFDCKYKELLNGNVTASALDDRCGIAAILYALEQLEGNETKYNVTVLFSAQEELGERGAKIAAYELNPDIAIAVDVSFGYVDGCGHEHEYGKLGGGPMIGVSPSLSRRLSDELIDIANHCKVPYQIEVMSGLTSTNADQFSVNRCGAEASTLSIPLRYMHTSVEVVNIDDVKYTGQLLAEFLKGDIA